MPDAVLQLLLPAECFLCRALLPYHESDHLVCPVCRSRWRPVTPPWCERCGQPEPHFGPCRLCAAWPVVLRRVRSAVWLDAGARDAAHALKYGGLPRIADDLAAVMARVLPPPDTSSALVPIPLGHKRCKARGYNQSEWLARALGRRWRLPVVVALLERTRDTASQTALTPAARLANVAGAFRVRNAECGMRNGRASSRDSPVHSAFRTPHSALVLVDDVFTTGATLAEAARALATAGAQAVSAVTFGRAVVPDFT
ncbi:MAG: ComF family protein [Gemmatimonadetes bacterium]|nr:ComF family protein [Gemmatimonadota bacterium]